MNKPYYDLISKIENKILSERDDYKKSLLQQSKETIMFSFVELFIYSRLKFFFEFLKQEVVYKQKKYFSIEELEKIYSLDNILLLIMRKYYASNVYEDGLTYMSLINYFKETI